MCTLTKINSIHIVGCIAMITILIINDNYSKKLRSIILVHSNGLGFDWPTGLKNFNKHWTFWHFFLLCESLVQSSNQLEHPPPSNPACFGLGLGSWGSSLIQCLCVWFPDRYFIPVCCFLLFNLCDWGGRSLTAAFMWVSVRPPQSMSEVAGQKEKSLEKCWKMKN